MTDPKDKTTNCEQGIHCCIINTLDSKDAIFQEVEPFLLEGMLSC